MATKKPIAKGKKAAPAKTVKKAPAKKAAVKAKPAVKKVPVKAKPATKTKAVKAFPVTKKPAVKAPAKKGAPVKVVPKKASPAPKKAVPVKAVVKSSTVKTKKAVPAPKPASVKAVKPAAPAPKPVTVSKPVSTVKSISKPVISTTPTKPTMSNVQKNTPPEKARFSDAELKEFKELIVGKLSDARTELINLQAQIINANENGTDDTSASFKMLEDGSDTLAKEEAANLAARQKKFIEQLEAALIRIENKTYGICRVTGRLIPKERLKAVPHTTQSMEAKLQQYRD
ncbi:hypothetical protein BH11BAC2_BH11BAC2_06740 [soil metagenome]